VAADQLLWALMGMGRPAMAREARIAMARCQQGKGRRHLGVPRALARGLSPALPLAIGYKICTKTSSPSKLPSISRGTLRNLPSPTSLVFGLFSKLYRNIVDTFHTHIVDSKMKPRVYQKLRLRIPSFT